MATNLDFYALAEDQRDLVRFLLSETDVVIYELSSDFDRDIRSFRSLAELEAVFSLGTRGAAFLQLWSPSVMEQPGIRHRKLAAVSGHIFESVVEGAGCIQLYLCGLRDGIIYHTHYGHWNEEGARARSIHLANDCDWRALSKLSSRIQRYIRSRLSTATLYKRPVLHHALAAVQRQSAGLWFGPETHLANSTYIKPNVA